MLALIRFAMQCSSRTTFAGKRFYSAKIDLTLCEQSNGIRVIQLNNKARRNCLSLAMLQSVREHLNDEEDLRCVIIRAVGNVFSSGHDLNEMVSEKGRQYHEAVFNECTDVMLSIQKLPVPVIAQVSGLATAAGCQLVASCDIAVASEQAQFATPGVNIGLFCSTPGIAVARAVPRKVALDMLFTGHPITATEALRHGLVSRVVSEEKLEAETMKVAERICESSKSVNALGKKFFYEQINMAVETAYEKGGAVMCDNLDLVDGQEGVKAFLSKRRPIWTHENHTMK